MLYGLIFTSLLAALALAGAWHYREELVASDSLADGTQRQLEAERLHHVEERKAWAAAAAAERAQLLASASEERAALIGAIDAARMGAVPHVAMPWPPGDPERLGYTEDDELRSVQAEAEARAAEVDRELLARGVAT
jgi:hypothetical protein